MYTRSVNFGNDGGRPMDDDDDGMNFSIRRQATANSIEKVEMGEIGRTNSAQSNEQ